MYAKHTRSIVVALVIALLVGMVALGMDSGNTGERAQTSYSSVAAAGPAPEFLPAGKVSLFALPVQRRGTTISLVKVLQRPDENSHIIDVLPPARELALLGRDASGSYVAIAGDSGELAGWLMVGELSMETAFAETHSLTKVYREADTQSGVIDILLPAQQLTLLGRSLNGAFYAVSEDEARVRVKGYVHAADVQPDAGWAYTRSVTKLYRSIGESQQVVTILNPAHSLRLVGQNPEGSWIAVVVEGKGNFAGWLRAGEIEAGVTLNDLPVFK